MKKSKKVRTVFAHCAITSAAQESNHPEYEERQSIINSLLIRSTSALPLRKDTARLNEITNGFEL